MKSKKGSGWTAWDAENGTYFGEYGGIQSYHLYELTKEQYDLLGEGTTEGDASKIMYEGRHLYMSVDDRCGPPYTVVFDDDYEKLCPWASPVSAGKVWPDELTDAAVELFASEENNREQRRRKREECEKETGKGGGQKLTLERAKELNDAHMTEHGLLIHAKNVMYAMGAMADRFGEDREHWMAVGYLHDYDYEEFPEEHLRHTEKELLSEGVDPADVRAILSHGYGICTDVKPETPLEKSLFTVDELTGIIQACARMRPNGISDLEVKSFMKKFKDRKFAAKCDRDLILRGCEMLGMDVAEVAEICISGMRPYAEDVELTGTGA